MLCKFGIVLLLAFNLGCQGQECPSSCSCNKLKRIIRCTELRTPPQRIPSYPQILDLKGNSLRRLNADAFGIVPTLSYLLLNENKIEQIRSFAFRGLPRLKQLNLRGNSLSVLRSGIFQGVSRTLKTIYLHEVRFTLCKFCLFRADLQCCVKS